MPAALEAAIAELTLGRGIDPEDSSAVEAWLERNGVAEDDREALRAGELRRLLLYRTLVRQNLWDALEAAIPRSMARLSPRFELYFDRFLCEVGPRSHYLRDITREFLDFCEPLWKTDPHLPPYAGDLARHEALHIEMAATPASSRTALSAEPSLDAGLGFVPSARRVHYAHAVQRLSESLEDRSEPSAEATDLLVYRSLAHTVHYLELSPFAAALLDRLISGDTLRAALFSAANQTSIALDDTVLAGTVGLLADLSERGVLTGPPATTETP